jgi:arabinogalactan oligomer / maltooligosaccharide transport system substrate-binding protein
MKRTFVSLAGAVTALCVGAAMLISAPAANAAPRPIVVWVDSSMRPAAKAVFADGYKKRKIKVVSVDMNTLSDQLLNGDLETAPDIVLIENEMTAELAAATLIAPLEIPAAVQRVLAPAALGGFKYGFSYYGMPMQRQNVAMITNANLIPTAPKNFKQLSNRALALKEAGTVTTPFAVGQGIDGDAYLTYPLFAGLGGFAFGTNPAGSLDPVKIGINNKKFRGNAGLIDTWNSTGLINSALTAEEAKTAFISGQAPFWIASPEDIPALRTVNFRYRITSVPTIVKGITPAPLLKSWGFAVTPFARQHGLLPAATDLVVNIASSAKSQSAFFAKSKVAALPANTVATAAVTDRVLLAFGAAATGAATPYPNIPQWGTVGMALGGAWRDATRGADAVPAKRAFARAQAAAVTALR